MSINQDFTLNYFIFLRWIYPTQGGYSRNYGSWHAPQSSSLPGSRSFQTGTITQKSFIALDGYFWFLELPLYPPDLPLSKEKGEKFFGGKGATPQI